MFAENKSALNRNNVAAATTTTSSKRGAKEEDKENASAIKKKGANVAFKEVNLNNLSPEKRQHTEAATKSGKKRHNHHHQQENESPVKKTQKAIADQENSENTAALPSKSSAPLGFKNRRNKSER